MDKRPENKRQDERVAIALKMNLVVFDVTASGVISGEEIIKLRSATISDISPSGMRVRTNDLKDSWLIHLTNGTILLALKFHLPGYPGPINAVGRVMWVKIGDKVKHILGIRFTSLKQGDKELIINFVAAQENNRQ